MYLWLSLDYNDLTDQDMSFALLRGIPVECLCGLEEYLASGYITGTGRRPRSTSLIRKPGFICNAV